MKLSDEVRADPGHCALCQAQHALWADSIDKLEAYREAAEEMINMLEYSSGGGLIAEFGEEYVHRVTDALSEAQMALEAGDAP